MVVPIPLFPHMFLGAACIYDFPKQRYDFLMRYKLCRKDVVVQLRNSKIADLLSDVSSLFVISLRWIVLKTDHKLIEFVV